MEEKPKRSFARTMERQVWKLVAQVAWLFFVLGNARQSLALHQSTDNLLAWVVVAVIVVSLIVVTIAGMVKLAYNHFILNRVESHLDQHTDRLDVDFDEFAEVHVDEDHAHSISLTSG